MIPFCCVVPYICVIRRVSYESETHPGRVLVNNNVMGGAGALYGASVLYLPRGKHTMRCFSCSDGLLSYSTVRLIGFSFSS